MRFLLSDLHCHSTLSSCCSDTAMTPDAILDFAEAHNYAELCLTDHLWDHAMPGSSDWYAPQDVEHVRSCLPLPQGKNLRFHAGCETELPASGIPALAKDNFALFDFVVIPPNHMHMKELVRPEAIDTPEKMAVYVQDRLENLLERDLPFHKIGLAHLTCSLMFSEGSVADVVSHMSEARLLRIFKGYAQAGTGIELNACAFREWSTRREELLIIYRAAREVGCRFYLSSDAHSVKSLEKAPAFLPEVIQALELTAAHQYHIPA